MRHAPTPPGQCDRQQQTIHTLLLLLLRQTPVTGWLEAFAAHPRIGDLSALRHKYGAFADSSRREQAAAASASDSTLQVTRSGSWQLAGAAARLAGAGAGRGRPAELPEGPARGFLPRNRLRPRHPLSLPGAPACHTPAAAQALVEWNAKYEARHGHLFIIYASGKPADFMLQQLRAR